MQMKDSIKLKGLIEIVDDNGKLIKRAENLVLLASRATILQNLFLDNKISDKIQGTIQKGINKSESLVANLPSGEYNHRLICGFAFGDHGAEKNLQMSTPFVPSFSDFADKNGNRFHPIPFIQTTQNAGDSSISITSRNGSVYEDLSSLINYGQVVSEDNSITVPNPTNHSLTSNVIYFNFPDYTSEGSYYCKAFNTTNSRVNFNQRTGELEYILKLDITPLDLVGSKFNEIGLVVANCKVESGIITKIEQNSVRLATRACFETISLASELLSSFSVYYHIFI